MGFEELVHVEGRMLGNITMILADGAGFSRVASFGTASVLAGAQKGQAGAEVVAVFGEGLDGAGLEAGAVHAAITGIFEV